MYSRKKYNTALKSCYIGSHNSKDTTLNTIHYTLHGISVWEYFKTVTQGCICETLRSRIPVRHTVLPSFMMQLSDGAMRCANGSVFVVVGSGGSGGATQPHS